ncbi:2-deoxyglucose-6-phosphatase [Datura stramonium]|uniref:2-deoxyglucose-6-phosphatase n=1 Tax=Datura stramonium TaxID=4076 RepID=A0ABS8RH72_DATST|nr:2-deoxyglucose-6-phosphatase [Datura stramonium]
MTSLNNNVSDQEAQHSCYQEWMKLQQQDLLELIHALHDSSSDSSTSDLKLKQLIEKSIKHFQDYADTRRHLARLAVSSGSFTPLVAKNSESHLNYLQGKEEGKPQRARPRSSPPDELQRRTIRLENRLSDKLASLQEDIADQPFAIIANEVAGNLGGI